MTELLEEIYPGEILLGELMKPMGITASQLAANINGLSSHISDLVNGIHTVMMDTALD